MYMKDMGKKIISFALALVMMISILPVEALAIDAAGSRGSNTPRWIIDEVAYPVTGGNIYFDRSDGSIRRADKSITEVVIPEMIDGIKVRMIDSGAFTNCIHLKNIVIPNSIQRIQDTAFTRCEKLETVVIPEGVAYIGDYVFQYCTNLKSIYLPKSLKEFGGGSFYNCSNFKDIYYLKKSMKQRIV